MGIVNRRNAVLGWAVWSLGKRAAKRKAKAAVPAIDAETKRPNRSAVALAVAATAGIAAFVRRRSGGDGDESA